MPHTTHAYPFEAKVARFAGELSDRFSAKPAPRSFLLVSDERGNVVALTFEDGAAGWHQRPRELTVSGTPHLFYDPLEDGMEFIWLSWHGVGQSVMERWIGQAFDVSDFLPMPERTAQAQDRLRGARFPESWGVMF